MTIRAQAALTRAEGDQRSGDTGLLDRPGNPGALEALNLYVSSSIASTRFSFLDRSRTREGHDDPQALRDTVALAAEAEALGYHRFWVSEHHSVPGVAGSAPTVLAAAVAAATSTIRVGTGGVMLPNHQPFVVAEQFGVLASLFPGRIDMGLGRSVGFTDGIRRALGRDKEDAEAFADRLAELLGWLDGTQQVHPEVHARPAEGLRIPPYVLATGEGAAIAAPLLPAARHRRSPRPGQADTGGRGLP